MRGGAYGGANGKGINRRGAEDAEEKEGDGKVKKEMGRKKGGTKRAASWLSGALGRGEGWQWTNRWRGDPFLFLFSAVSAPLRFILFGFFPECVLGRLVGRTERD